MPMKMKGLNFMKKQKKVISILLAVALLCTGCGGKEGEDYVTVETDVANNFPLKAEPVDSNPQLTTSNGPYAVIHTTAGDITVVLYPEQAPKAVENFTTYAKNGYYNGSIFYWVEKNSIIQSGSEKVAEKETEGETEESSTSFEQLQDAVIQKAATSVTENTNKSIWGGDFEDEISDVLHNFHGALSMANDGVNTNNTEFYFVAKKEIMSQQDIEINLYANELYYDASLKLLAGVSQEEQTAIVDDLNNKTQAIATDGVPDTYKFKYTAAVNKYLEVGGAPSLDSKHTVFGQVVYGMNIVDAISQVKIDI